MGVLECDRKECDNIMCDRYSRDYGYICSDCFEELVIKAIHPRQFMNIPKSDNAYNSGFYEEIFTRVDKD